MAVRVPRELELAIVGHIGDPFASWTKREGFHGRKQDLVSCSDRKTWKARQQIRWEGTGTSHR